MKEQLFHIIKSKPAQNILILGAGVTGKATLDFCLNLFDNPIVLANSGNPDDWSDKFKSLAPERLSFVDLDDEASLEDAMSSSLFYMRSPGIDPRTEIYRRWGDKEVGEIELAYLYLRQELKSEAKIIALTGTNGKTTTVHFLDHLLKGMGHSVYLGGNVGFPFIDISKRKEKIDYIILELSSFQVEQLQQFRCDIGIILNISPSHEERYHEFSEYRDAKIKLLGLIAEDGKSIVQNNVLNSLTDNELANLLIKPEVLDRSHYKMIKKHMGVIGEHNLENALFCHQVLCSLALEINLDLFKTFKGVSFRLERIDSKHSPAVFNDAKSTNKDSSITAVRAMQDNFDRFSLILGGQLRAEKIDFYALFDVIADSESEIELIFIGEAKHELKRHADEYDLLSSSYSDLTAVFQDLQSRLRKPSILFSPGFPSFDQYRNYIARGNDFTRLVEKYL